MATRLVQSIGPTQRVGKGVFLDWPKDLVPDGACSDGQNVEPRGQHPESATIGKAPGWAKFSGTAVPGVGPVMLMVDFIKAAGTRQFLAATTTRLGKYNTGTKVFDDQTGGLNLLGANSTTPLFGAVLNDLFIVGDGNDAPRKYDGTTWGLLGGSPPTCVGWDVYEGHLLGWSTSAVNYRAQWSDLTLPEVWSGGESGFLDFRDENLIPLIAGGKMRRQYLLYKEQLGGVYALTYVGLPLIMISELVIPRFGTISPRGVAVHGDTHYVMGSDENLYAITPSGHSLAQPFTAAAATQIAQGLAKRLYSRINWNARKAAFVAIDPAKTQVIFAIPEGSFTTCSRAYLYNWQTGGMGEMEFPFGTAASIRDPETVIINNLVGTINSLTGAIIDLSGVSKDRQFLGGTDAAPFVYRRTGENKDGVAMDSWVTTKWAGTGDGRYTRVRGVEADFTGTANAELGTADNIAGTMSYMALGTLGTTGRADANQSGRYVAARVRSQGVGDTWELSGHRLDALPVGRR